MFTSILYAFILAKTIAIDMSPPDTVEASWETIYVTFCHKTSFACKALS
jgi:hypothetical protein